MLSLLPRSVPALLAGLFLLDSEFLGIKGDTCFSLRLFLTSGHFGQDSVGSLFQQGTSTQKSELLALIQAQGKANIRYADNPMHLP